MFPRRFCAALVIPGVAVLAGVCCAVLLADYGISTAVAATAATATLITEFIRNTTSVKIMVAGLFGALLPIGMIVMVLLGSRIEEAFAATLALWALAAAIVCLVLRGSSHDEPPPWQQRRSRDRR